MGGECLNSAVINGNGVAGDRCWAVLNGETREICHAKRWAELLNYRASLLAGEDLQVSGFGEAILHIHSRTVRCSMPSREQQWCGIKTETKMARAMVEHCDRHLGVNVMVEKGGIVSAGDELLLLT